MRDKAKFQLIFLMLCFIIGTILGCSDVKPEMLPGRYSFNDAYRDSIIIYRDSNYTHKYISSSGRLFTSNGTWKFNKVGNRIIFNNFVFFNDEGSLNRDGGYWDAKVKVSSNELRLIYSSEDNIYFFKKLK